MAFKKAEPNMPKVSIALYGESGTGKTFTSLILAEGLARISKKRVALIDTDPLHPSGMYGKRFDFDVLCPANFNEAYEAVKNLDTNTYGVLVIDTITYLWDWLMDAKDINGEQVAHTNKGLPQQFEWGKVKRPFRDLLLKALDLKCHNIITGRENIEYDKANQNVPIGYKMNAEKNTAYETHALFRLYRGREAHALGMTNNAILQLAICENDKTTPSSDPTSLKGKRFENIVFEDIKPLVDRICGEHIAIPTATEAAFTNAPVMRADTDNVDEFNAASAKLAVEFKAKVFACKKLNDLKDVAEAIKTGKKNLSSSDYDSVKAAFDEKKSQIKEAK